MSSIVTVIKEVGTYRNNYVHEVGEPAGVHVFTMNAMCLSFLFSFYYLLLIVKTSLMWVGNSCTAR